MKNSKVNMGVIYVMLYVVTFILSYLFEGNNSNSNYFSIYIVIINTIVFLMLVKYFEFEKKIVSKFLIVIMLLFIPLIIDTDYFISSYMQNTVNLIFPESVLFICNLFLIPFVYIFEILFKFNIIKLSYIVIPAYIFGLNYINKKML